jgi:hypothetical protein
MSDRLVIRDLNRGFAWERSLRFNYSPFGVGFIVATLPQFYPVRFEHDPQSPTLRRAEPASRGKIIRRRCLIKTRVRASGASGGYRFPVPANGYLPVLP